MRFALYDASGDPRISGALLAQIAHAIELQLYEDYAPLWQAQGIPVRVVHGVTELTRDDCGLGIFMKSDDPGAVAWHTYSTDGRSFGKAFLEEVATLTEGPSSLSAALSHEALEAAQDPYVNTLKQVDATTLEWEEIADRTEGDCYEKEGITVSNLLGPRAFRDGPGPYDYMDLLKSPWEIRPGGYVDRWNLKTGKVKTFFGEQVQEGRKAQILRRHRHARRLAHVTQIHDDAQT
jgi:hypothetical protein